jgi:hypothetical protein
VRKFAGNEKITSETRIYQDLGIGGDDAWELLDDLRQAFRVDFSDMDFSLYFPNETEMISEKFVELLRRAPRRPPLTIDHLVKIIECGRWFEPKAPDPKQ